MVTPWIEGPPGEFSASVTGYDGTWLATISLRADVSKAAGAPRPGETSAAIVTVEGDIDHDTSPLLRQALLRALPMFSHVSCDLNKVTFFGAAGVSALLDGCRCATAAGSVLTLRGARGMTRRVLETFGLAAAIIND